MKIKIFISMSILSLLPINTIADEMIDKVKKCDSAIKCEAAKKEVIEHYKYCSLYRDMYAEGSLDEIPSSRNEADKCGIFMQEAESIVK